MANQHDHLESAQAIESDIRKPRNILRFIVIIGICLSAGAVINVGVAWGCAIGIELDEQVNPDMKWTRRCTHSKCGWWISGGVARTGALRAGLERSRIPMVFPGEPSEPYLPQWSRLKAECPKHGETPKMGILDARGWPMLSMVGYLDFDPLMHMGPYKISELSSTIMITPQLSGDDSSDSAIISSWAEPKFLPLLPLWKGFIVNTLLYGCLVFGIFFGPRLVRQGLHWREGSCPKCGYELRGNYSAGCPECGWKRV